jgi:hypothetical protein
VADLKTQWKNKSKEKINSFVKTPNGTVENDTLKDTTGMARLRCTEGSK